MSEWKFAQTDPSQELAQLHFFSMKKKQQPSGEVEFRITVYEYLTPAEPSMLFFAKADKQTNQKTVPFTPCGWGKTLYEALSRCVQSIEKHPYEGE